MNRKIEKEFEKDVSVLDTGELAVLHDFAEGDMPFAREAGEEFVVAVHNVYEQRVNG